MDERLHRAFGMQTARSFARGIVRHQKGNIFRRGRSWFFRYSDDVRHHDGTIKRKVICKKLPVSFGDQYRTKASLKSFADEILAPINAGKTNAQSTMRIVDFVEQIYLPEYADVELRPSTRKGYRDMWRVHIKHRLERMTLRGFRTVDGHEMMREIARDAKLGRNSLKHVKSFLSGVFKQAKRLGILDGVNPMQDVGIPRSKQPAETHAYSLPEVRKMLVVIDEPARTIVLTAALTGLRKGEIRGLRWEDFSGTELSVQRSLWNSEATEPKNPRSKASIPVVKQLTEALEAHRKRMGKLAVGPIFQSGNGSPLNLDNVARRIIIPALERCEFCEQQKSEHKNDDHLFVRDSAFPRWHGWHAFRRGIATNLHQLGVADKDIQAILRHSNIGITMNIYVKSVAESQVDAMDLLGEEFEKQDIIGNRLHQKIQVN
jgi:integrase